MKEVQISGVKALKKWQKLFFLIDKELGEEEI